MEWLNTNQIKVNLPKRLRKLTATRFASIFNLNPWKTPFATWCEITKTYEEPFEETKYTAAGKAIEPIQIAYMKRNYHMTDIVTPTDMYGADYFNKTYGDFFSDTKIFGGMWDSLRCKNGKPTTVLEFKTTKRAEDWQGEIPEYYALQAALYAYLLGVDDVIMVASFLDDADYDHPEQFKPSVENTITIPFKLSKRYPHFKEEYITPAIAWWKEYVETGISPEYSEKEDADILKELRTNNLNPESDIEAIIAEADDLKIKIDGANAEMKAWTDRYKKLTEQIKEYVKGQFRDGDTKVTIEGEKCTWTCTKAVKTTIDEDALKADGLYEKYHTKTATTFTLTPKIIKENKK